MAKAVIPPQPGWIAMFSSNLSGLMQHPPGGLAMYLLFSPARMLCSDAAANGRAGEMPQAESDLIALGGSLFSQDFGHLPIDDFNHRRAGGRRWLSWN